MPVKPRVSKIILSSIRERESAAFSFASELCEDHNLHSTETLRSCIGSFDPCALGVVVDDHVLRVGVEEERSLRALIPDALVTVETFRFVL